MARTPPPAPLFTFANGRTVGIRHVSHLLEQEVRRSLTAPQPPINEVDYGDERGAVAEPNYYDPDYQQALARHNQAVHERTLKLFMLRGAEFTVDAEAVAQLRADMAEIGVELPADDRFVYLYHLCIGSEEEGVRFVQAVRGESQPTQEAVDEASDSFRGDL